MNIKPLTVALLMVFVIFNPYLEEDNFLQDEIQVDKSSSSNPQFLSNSGFISRNSGFEIWDAVSEGNTIYMAVTARFATSFANVTLGTGAYVLEFDPINNTVTNIQSFSAEIRAIKQNQTSLIILEEGYGVPSGGFGVSNVYIMNKNFTNLTKVGSRSGGSGTALVDVHLTDEGIVYVAGVFGPNFDINGTTFSVTSSISAIRYNLSNASDTDLTTFPWPTGMGYGSWSAGSNEHYKIPRISPESNGTKVIGVYRGSGSFLGFCIDYINSQCQQSGGGHSDNLLSYKVGKIMNNTLEGLNVNTCEAELAAGGNNFFYGSFTHIKQQSFDPVCGTQSELGKFTIRHYATNLTKVVIFDPLSSSGANTINYGEGGLILGVIPFDQGVFAFHNNLDYSSYYGFTEVPTVSGNLISTYLIDSDGDNVADINDDYPQDPTQTTDSDGDGYGDRSGGINGDDCPLQNGNSTDGLLGCFDNDGDGLADEIDAFPQIKSQKYDADRDGYGDNNSMGAFQIDQCPLTFGTSTIDVYGCLDSDNDGYSDDGDDFELVSSQWSDSDEDGYGDEYTGFQGDACPQEFGTSFEDRFGCLDSDNDGWSDDADAFPYEVTQFSDRDLDGYGDNQSVGAALVDLFPSDTTQWNDSDSDGYGDNEFGNQADKFPNDPMRWQDNDRDGVADEDDAFPYDSTQSMDVDQDGYGDNPYGTDGDWFSNDSTRWNDTDRDGVADEDDAFPNDRSQSEDMDGDGYGDNPDGENPDAFPSNPDEWQDTDGDFVGNNEDTFPFDPSQTTDTDGDGFGDNPVGNGADRFPGDPSQWMDIDGDGYGDNQSGTFPDAFITDPTQWSDLDGDGFGDNPGGRQADAFPNDPTQWEDVDGDGLGDYESGNNPDPFLFDFDNDGYNDSIDPLPKFASPGDLDNDGVLDGEDMFPEDFREWADNDDDEVGDNADTDDDNDGWSDADELREGTDPFSSSEQPVDSFEIVIPGTAVGLGAWDLIGIFGGVPLFIWIGFGFITRNGRTAKYEEKLRSANTRDELEGVARQWEYSLMLRMLGPHQGIRLERLRAELDDVFERQNQTLSSLEQSEYNQTQLVQEEMNLNEKQVPEINLKPDIDAVGNPDEKGYEWISSEDGKNWYRTQGSKDDWVEFSN